MNADPVDAPLKKWSWTRWLTLIAVVLAVHVALIFIFTERKPPARAAVENGMALALAGEPSDGWLALNSATLFGQPNQNGFAGIMWMALPPLPFRQQDWTEKPHWLGETDSLSVAGLVMPFNRFVQTNYFAGIHLEFNLPPQLTVPALAAEFAFAPASTLQIEGELTKRQLLNPMKLPSWPSTGVVAPSMVQVLVDAAGNVVSAVLLPSDDFMETSAPVDSDAGKRADARALELARTAHFAPLAPSGGGLAVNPASHLTIGRLIFKWQTAPETTAGSAAQGVL